MAHLDRAILGANLRTAREARTLTQENVAALLGTSKQLISHWETGRCMITLPHLMKVAKHYGVTIDQLVGPRRLLKTLR